MSNHNDSSFEPIESDKLRFMIEKLESLEEEKADIAENIKEAYAEAKSLGFDTKIIRQVIRMRKMKQEELQEQEEMLTVYLHALGMIPGSDRHAA